MENLASSSSSVTALLVQGWFVAQLIGGVLAIVAVELKEVLAADRA